MTALVEILGLLPFLLATGVGSEVMRPLATVVVGGLISSTALTLFILPLVYEWMEQRMQSQNRI
jgi:cobalt-zinc-cadmium resistance protein CzcA